MAVQPPVAPTTAALAAPPSLAVAAAQPQPAPMAPPQMAHPPDTLLPPMATAQAPQYLQGPPSFYYEGEEPPYFKQRRPDRLFMLCFLCDEEGHFAYRCPARTLLQRMLRQQAQEPLRQPTRGQVLELPAADDSSSSSAVSLN